MKLLKNFFTNVIEQQLKRKDDLISKDRKEKDDFRSKAEERRNYLKSKAKNDLDLKAMEQIDSQISKDKEKLGDFRSKNEEKKDNKKTDNLGPTKSNKPTEPTKPIEPTEPTEPTKTTEPTKSSTADASKDSNITTEDMAELQYEEPELFKVAGLEDKSPEDINPKEMADKMTSDKRFWELIEKEKREGRLSRIATVVSAIITAASGGRVPFIPFNAITGADQQMAYLRKAVGVYADQAAKDAANVNTEKSQEEVDKLKANPNTIETAKEATKTDVARRGNVEEQSQLKEIQKDYDEFIKNLDVDKQRQLADIKILLEESLSKIRVNESKEMLRAANELQLELSKEIIKMNFSLEELNRLARYYSSIGGQTLADAIFKHINSATSSVGNVVGAVKK